jgi:glycosyltransferase involved in cell wall biosynthesis
MPDGALRVAFMGGVPASLGGGGLELQMQRTAQALQRGGVEVFAAAAEPEPRPFDVLHAFGSEPDVWHALHHWRRNPAPLVLSPVIVAAPGAQERLLRLSARLPLASLSPRMRSLVVRRADASVALTAHEARLLRALGARRVEVIPNGVEPPGPDAPLPDGLPEGYVLLLGAVSARKRQADTVRALGAAGLPVVVAGGFDGTPAERRRFEAAVVEAGARWTGEVDPPVARTLLRRARALVHLSRAEGQSLAVVEALAEGTPVIATPLPANAELAARHPAHVRLVEGEGEVAGALTALERARGPAPSVPTWDDVAAALQGVYRSVLAGRASTPS